MNWCIYSINLYTSSDLGRDDAKHHLSREGAQHWDGISYGQLLTLGINQVNVFFRTTNIIKKSRLRTDWLMNQPDVAATLRQRQQERQHYAATWLTPYTWIVQSVLENSGFLHGKYYKVLFLNPLQTALNACKHLGFGEMAPLYIPELAPQLKCTA